MFSRILYSSTSLCDRAQTMGLVEQARQVNARCEVTGALHLTAENMFFQYLEGPRDTVSKLSEKILCDPRHTLCHILDQRDITSRAFPKWPMAWLPDTACSRLMRNVIAAQTSPSGFMDGSSVGAFFYAMAHTGECE